MMGRKRKGRRDLPERVYFNHGSHYFVDRQGKWHNLGRDYIKAMTKYAELNNPERSAESMGKLIDLYLVEESVKKAPRTHENNLLNAKRLRAFFGKMCPDDVTTRHCYQYIDERGAPIAANRDIALLSSVFKFGIRKGKASDNPCRLVSRNTERPRDREVTDAEFMAVRGTAGASIQCAMDIAEMLGMRLGDILILNDRDHVTPGGLFVITGKRKKKMLYRWTPHLRALQERCKALPRPAAKVVNINDVPTIHWIVNNEGQPYTDDGFKSTWRRVMLRAVREKLIQSRFTFHDLRSRAADLSKNATELLGHDDPRTANRVYRRATRKVTPNDPTVS